MGKFLCSIAEGTSNYLVRQHQENPEIGLDLMHRNAQAMAARDLNECGSRWSDVGLRNRLQKRTATSDYVPDGKGGEEHVKNRIKNLRQKKKNDAFAAAAAGHSIQGVATAEAMQNSRFHRNRLVAPSSVPIDTSIASASVPINTSIASASVPIDTSIASASVPIDTCIDFPWSTLQMTTAPCSMRSRVHLVWSQ